MTTGRAQVQMPPLSQAEVEIALQSKHSGMSDDEAMRQYQKHKAQLLKDGQMGPHYRGQ